MTWTLVMGNPYIASTASSIFTSRFGRPHLLTSLLFKSSKAFSKVTSLGAMFCDQNQVKKTHQHLQTHQIKHLRETKIGVGR